MFSIPLDCNVNDKVSFLKNGLNIIIIEKSIENDKELLSIINPPRSEHYDMKSDKNTVILFKYNDYFEPVVLRTVTGGHEQGAFKEHFINSFDPKIADAPSISLMEIVKF